MDNTYNGWSNYATWRINLEIFDDYVDSLEDDELTELAKIKTSRDLNDMVKTSMSWHRYADKRHHYRERLQTIVEDAVIGDGEDMAHSYALAFVDGVNYTEILDSLIEQAREAVL